MFRRNFIYLIIGCLLWGGLGWAEAAEPIASLTITPSLHEQILRPGETVSQKFQVTNNTNTPLPLKVYLRTFGASDEYGDVAINDDPDVSRLAVTSWARIDISDLILQAGASRQVTVDFSPPADLPPGGYYGVLFFEPLLPESFFSQQSALMVGGRVGALLFLVGPGDLKEKGSVVGFATTNGWYRGPIEFSLRVKNEGNTHSRASGTIELKNLWGKTRTINVPEFTILPGKIRQQHLVADRVKWAGVYQSKLKLVYGSDKKTILKEQTFIYLPVFQLIVILLSGVTVVLLVSVNKREKLIKAIKILLKGET